MTAEEIQYGETRAMIAQVSAVRAENASLVQTLQLAYSELLAERHLHELTRSALDRITKLLKKNGIDIAALERMGKDNSTRSEDA